MALFDKLRRLDQSIGGAVLRRESELITDFHDDLGDQEPGNQVLSIDSSKLLRQTIDTVLARVDESRLYRGNNAQNYKQWLVVRELCLADEPMQDIVATVRYDNSIETSSYFCLTLRNLRDSSVIVKSELVF
jgi:hypothetical protein